MKKFHPKPRTSSHTSGVNLVLKMCHKRLHLLKSGVLGAPSIENIDEDSDKKCFKNIFVIKKLPRADQTTFENIYWHFLLFYKIGFTWWLATKSPCLSQNHLVCHKITWWLHQAQYCRLHPRRRLKLPLNLWKTQ